MSNETLAELSQRYHLPDNVIGAAAALPTIRASAHTRACLFEAYIAAVFYDFLNSERPGLYPSGSQSTAPSVAAATIGSDTSDRDSLNGGSERAQTPTPTSTEPDTPSIETLSLAGGDKTPPVRPASAALSATSSSSLAVPSAYPAVTVHADLPPLVERYKRTRGMAADYIEMWLRPLFTPLAEYGLGCMRAKWKEYEAAGGAGEGGEDWDLDAQAVGALSALNQFTSAKWGRLPCYTDAGTTDSGGWRYAAEVASPDGKVYAADAVRPNKKAAQTMVAYKIGRQMQADGYDLGLAA